MKSIEHTFISEPVEISKIKSDYTANNKIYFSIEKNSKGNQVYFYNPEFFFEKQLLINANASKVFAFLKAAENSPQDYQKFTENGFVFIKIDNDYLNIFVRHISNNIS